MSLGRQDSLEDLATVAVDDTPVFAGETSVSQRSLMRGDQTGVPMSGLAWPIEDDDSNEAVLEYARTVGMRSDADKRTGRVASASPMGRAPTPMPRASISGPRSAFRPIKPEGTGSGEVRADDRRPVASPRRRLAFPDPQHIDNANVKFYFTGAADPAPAMRDRRDAPRYHGAQRCGAGTRVAETAREPTVSYPDMAEHHREAHTNLGVGPQWRPEEDTCSKDDLMVRLLGLMMDRLTCLEKQVERLLQPVGEVPSEVPTPAPEQRKKKQTRKKKTKDNDRKRVAGDSVRPASTRACPVSLANLTVEESRTRPSVTSVPSEASQSLDCRKCEEEIYVPTIQHLRKIRDSPVPRKRRELAKFIDATRALRDFVPGFEIMIAPLTSMLSPKRKFRWTPVAQRAWLEAKAALAGRLELSKPQPGRAYHVQPEAKEEGMTCTVFQVNEQGEQRVLHHTSVKYHAREGRYSMEEKRALAVSWALKMQGAKFPKQTLILHPQKGSLEWLKLNRDKLGRLTRWTKVLEESQYAVARRSLDRKVPERLTQLPEGQQSEEDRKSEEPEKTVTLGMLASVPTPEAGREPLGSLGASQQDGSHGTARRTTPDGERREPAQGTQLTNPVRPAPRRILRDIDPAVKQYQSDLLHGEVPNGQDYEAACLEYCWRG